MEYLLQLKIGALFGLLLLTLLVGFIPARVKWFRDTNGTETHRTVLSLISCFAGGVFLAACLLDILPDYLSDIRTELVARQVQSSFPIPEFILAGGFFIVLVLEKLVLHCQERRVHAGEREPLLQGNGHGHGHGEVVRPELESRGHHIHVDLQAHSPFRSFMLFLSLSLHSVFEGLAIGLQNTDSKVRAGNQRLLSAVVLYIKVSQSGITVLVVVVVISG
uniref:Solute carrier family 39 member 1 n=1 Tax=Periophthalmus magnuspinnatus TaxID=409849 RepID=A0A3B3ZID5_9GOBI